MIQITDLDKCCGCTACASICPHGAISMRGDALGFQYPQVDAAKCVECGLCDKVCAFVPDVEKHTTLAKDIQLEVVAVKHNDPNVVKSSQSGGAFTAISDIILEEGGIVYGAAYRADHTVGHVRACTKDERDALRGSKYTQSDMDGVFRLVRADLQNGLKVMFTGTPCQVAGLKSYIPQSLQRNLLLVDIVCHGVPSPAIWKDYLKYMGRKGEIVKAVFRDKTEGSWRDHKESFTYANGKKFTPDTYRVLFHKNIMLRHSCAICPYDALSHLSDITIADFWGVEEILPQMDGTDGTSMVFCNSDKGQELFDKAAQSLKKQNAVLSYDFMARRNPNLISPAKIYKDRMKFEEAYQAKGFLYVARRWGDLGWRYRMWLLKRFILGKR